MVDFEAIKDPARFEDLCKLILKIEYPNLETIDGKGGDGGSDSFIGTIDGQSVVFQFKYYIGRMKPSHWSKIDDGLRKHKQFNKSLRQWYLLIPNEFTPEEYKKWEDIQLKYPEIECILWNRIHLTEKILHYQKNLIIEFPEIFPALEVSSHIIDLLSIKKENQYTRFFPDVPFFIGRYDDIQKLKRLTNSERIITIHGLGGIGKTSLAYRILNKFNKIFDRIVAVYLEKRMSYESFILTICQELGINKENKTLEQIVAEIQQFIGRTPKILFFFDNFEAISDEKSQKDNSRILRFLKEIPINSKILITSRNNRNLEGESLYHLTGLNEFHATILFLKHASTTTASKLTTEFIQRLFILCKDCSGHPLLIKILAKSYNGGGLSEINEISQNLVTSDEEEIDRFKNIDKCFDYTFNKLTSNERSVLECLLFFSSPYNQDMIVDIFGDILPVFNSLLQKGLIETYDPTRYLFRSDKLFYYFHPLAKDYLNRKIERSEANKKYRQSYVTHFLRLIDNYEKISSADEVFNLFVLNQILKFNPNDFDNAIGMLDLNSRSIYLNRFGLILGNQQFHDVAKRIHHECLKIDLKMGGSQRNERIANDYHNLGNSYMISDLSDSLEFYKKALALTRDPYQKMQICYSISKLFLINDKIDLAKKYNMKAFKEIDKLKNKDGYSKAFYWYCDHLAFFHKFTENYLKMLGFSMSCVKMSSNTLSVNRQAIYRLINDMLTASLAFIKLEKYRDALKMAHRAFHMSIDSHYVYGMLLACRRFITVHKLRDENNLECFYTEVRRKISIGLKQSL